MNSKWWIILLATALIGYFGRNAEAQDKGVGFGALFGEPTGPIMKAWIDEQMAIDVAAAWSFSGDEDAVSVHADLLFHNYSLFNSANLPPHKGKLALYFGVGGRAKFEHRGRVGVRIPVGLDYLFPKAPVDIFGELVPILDLAPDTELSFNAGIGVRVFVGG